MFGIAAFRASDLCFQAVIGSFQSKFNLLLVFVDI